MKTYELQSRIRSNCFSSTIYCYLRNLTSPAPDSYIVSFVVVFSNVTFRKYVSQRETQISSKLFHAVEEKNLTYVASTRFKNLFLSFHEKCPMFPRTLFFFLSFPTILLFLRKYITSFSMRTYLEFADA